MRWLKLGVCLLYTLGLGLTWQAGNLVAGGDPERWLRWRNAVLRAWGRGLLALMGARLVRRGPLPPAPALVVSNHLSMVDLVVYAAELPCVFVSKDEVAQYPWIGAVAAQLGTIFIDRESFADLTRVNAAVEQALARGLTVVFFPEATTTFGDNLLPFRSPLLEPAARSGRPVHYAALHYATPPGARPAREHVTWGGVVSLREHLLRVLALPGFTATVTYGQTPIADPDRKSLARKLHAAVAALFRAV